MVPHHTKICPFLYAKVLNGQFKDTPLNPLFHINFLPIFTVVSLWTIIWLRPRCSRLLQTPLQKRWAKLQGFPVSGKRWPIWNSSKGLEESEGERRVGQSPFKVGRVMLYFSGPSDTNGGRTDSRWRGRTSHRSRFATEASGCVRSRVASPETIPSRWRTFAAKLETPSSWTSSVSILNVCNTPKCHTPSVSLTLVTLQNVTHPLYP